MTNSLDGVRGRGEVVAPDQIAERLAGAPPDVPAAFQARLSAGLVLDGELTRRTASSRLVVFLPGAQANEGPRRMPFYHRRRWVSDLPDAHVLALADPALRQDERLRGAWFLHPQADLIAEVADAVAGLAFALGVDTPGILFYGSSAGGFGALMMASRLAGAAAIAEIPRTDLERNPFKRHVLLLEEAVVGRPLAQFRLSYPERVNVLARFSHEGRIPPFVLVTNTTDYCHPEHLELMEGLSRLESVERLGVQRIITTTTLGHYPLGKQEALGLIEAHFMRLDSAGPPVAAEPIEAVASEAGASRPVASEPGVSEAGAAEAGAPEAGAVAPPDPAVGPRPAPTAAVNPQTTIPRQAQMNHYVSIRFSVRGIAGEPEFADDADRAAWFKARADILRRCTGPSLLRQTTPLRAVFILMDSADQERWEQHLNLPAPFVPLFIERGEINSAPAAHIEGTGDSDVILTRLDSDDALADNYLEEIGRTARTAQDGGREEAYIVACNGYKTDFRVIQTVYHTTSSYLSVYAHRYSGQGVYQFNHMNVHQHNPILNETALWLQVIHTRNISNRIRIRRCQHDPDREIHNGSPLPVEQAWPLVFLPVWDPRPNAGLAS